MTPVRQTGAEAPETGDAASEARTILESLRERYGLDTSAVAFHLGLSPRTVERWLSGGIPVTPSTLVSVRLFAALMVTCPEAARAARVYSAEEWSDLQGGLRRTHQAAWSQQGRYGSIRDGADTVGR